MTCAASEGGHLSAEPPEADAQGAGPRGVMGDLYRSLLASWTPMRMIRALPPSVRR
jgi:hypothetical protein